MNGYEALREGAAWIDLSGRGHILVYGEDRKRLLHAMTTNHVEQLQPGQGCYAFFLNDKGRIVADVNILCRPEFLILDTEPETRASVYEHLDRFIIADDVTLDDQSDKVAILGLEGPKAADVLREVGAPAPSGAVASSEWGESLVAVLTVTGGAGFRLFVPLEARDRVISQLESAGAVAAEPEAARVVRIENGHPRYGEEVTDRYLAQETQLLHAMHFSKGCYLGQEIVERVRSRGQLHRHLMRLELDGDQPLEPGFKLTSGGNPSAEVASSAYSPGLRKTVALAYVRTDSARPGAVLEGGAVPATVTGPPA